MKYVGKRSDDVVVCVGSQVYEPISSSIFSMRTRTSKGLEEISTYKFKS
jgi:hypothetical protein